MTVDRASSSAHAITDTAGPAPATTRNEPVPPLKDPALDNVASWKKPFLALDQEGFRNLWLGMLPGTMAMQMGMITTGYVAFDISGSAASVGFVSLGSGIPMLLLGLVGGVVADRFPKRNVLLLTQTLIGVAAVLNAILVLTGVVQIWHLMAVAAIQGTGFAFNMPSRQAFIGQLVSRDRLMNAVALNNAGMNFCRVIGPSIAGALIAVPFIGAGGVYVIMAAMYGYVVISLLRINDRGVPLGTQRPPPIDSLREGLRYIRGNGVVSTLLTLAFVPVLLGMPYQQLMPVFAEDVFNVGPSALGLLLTFNGIGALAGSLTIAGLTAFQRKGLLQMGLGIAFGLSLAVFAFSESFHIGLGTLLIIGFVSSGYQALNSTLVMNNCDPAYHGRVMSVYMLTFSAMPLAVVPYGALSDAFTAPLTIGIGALLLAAIIAVVGIVHPSYRFIR
ncbi:MAG: MFS transporter [Thermomicrobiales bacterium]|nr:MFS transporter [Thermomicrobiales bacterium]